MTIRIEPLKTGSNQSGAPRQPKPDFDYIKEHNRHNGAKHARSTWLSSRYDEEHGREPKQHIGWPDRRINRAELRRRRASVRWTGPEC